jgi:hypothetical protein
MKLIKYPTQIKPSRVTQQLIRRDEMFSSPVTGIQQTASRGNAHWQTSIEYRDLSDSERDIVQAFLMKCQGPLSSFKLPDFGNYEIRGSVSDWIDVFSGHGSFTTVAGSSTTKVNSWLGKSTALASNITEDGMARFEWRVGSLQVNLSYSGPYSYEAGKSYVARIKHFQYPSKASHSLRFAVSSDGGGFWNNGQSLAVYSTDNITMPFYVGTNVNSSAVKVVEYPTTGAIGDYWKYSDFRVARCALVCNSENLLKFSNDFAQANWSKVNVTVESGGMDSPNGTFDGAWKLYGDNTNNLHYISQTITKVTTEDMYSFSCKAKAAELAVLRVRMQTIGADNSEALFWLNSGTITGEGDSGTFTRGHATMFDIGSGWYGCHVAGITNSLNNIAAIIFVQSGSLDTYTNDGSSGIWIANAQLTKFPFMGQYVPTTSVTVVGTGWQTGSNLVVDGLDPGDIIKAGTRFEVVNRFHGGGEYERSEFKRTTEEVVAHREGWAIIPFDPPIRNAPETKRSQIETMHNPVIFADPEIKCRLLKKLR